MLLICSLSHIPTCTSWGYVKTNRSTPTSSAITTFTATAMPPPTTTPIPLPVLAGTTIPQPEAVISSENVAGVVQLARWGKGTVEQIAYSPDGNLLALASSLGFPL